MLCYVMKQNIAQVLARDSIYRCPVCRACYRSPRPVAKNFQVGVLSLRVLGPGESEARRVEGDGGSWGGGLPLCTS